MKMKKLVAAALALSFMAGVAGCSKVKSVTEEEVTGACEDMDFDEIDDDIGVDEHTVRQSVPPLPRQAAIALPRRSR